METIHIKPRSRHHGISFSVIGIGLCLILLALPKLFAFSPSILYIAGILAFLSTGLLGIFKLLEPRVSLTLCSDYLEFHHRYGGWVLKWANIIRIEQPALQDGLEWFSLPYIGLKIREYDPLLNIVSPRLAVKLLSEQRSLLIQVLQQEYISGHLDANFDLIEEPFYKSPAGHLYQGAVAMLGHRMARMRAMLGFDLLIPANSLDRDPKDFAFILRRYQGEALEKQNANLSTQA